MDDILQYACKAITKDLNVTRCVAWIIVGDGLEAKQEFSADGPPLFQGTILNSTESMGIVLEFFSNDSEFGVISVPNISENGSPSLSPPALQRLIESSDLKSRLLGPLRSGGIFSGFIDIQQSDHTRDWTESERSYFEEVLLLLSVMVQLIFDVCKVGADFDDLMAMHTLTGLFHGNENRESVWKEAAALVASHLGFEHAQVFLKNEINGADTLVPQIESEGGHACELTDATNEVVVAFCSPRGKVYNLPEGTLDGFNERIQTESTGSFFGNEMAVLFPLKRDEKTLGVLCLWKRRTDCRRWITQQGDVGSKLTQLFADYAAVNS